MYHSYVPLMYMLRQSAYTEVLIGLYVEPCSGKFKNIQ